METLTKDQVEKFEAVKWLTDPFGGYGSGRTQLLAMAYVQHSINYRTWITVVNHGNSHPMANRELTDRIIGIVNGMGKYTVKIRRNPPAILVESAKREPFGGNNPYQYMGQDMNKKD